MHCTHLLTHLPLNVFHILKLKSPTFAVPIHTNSIFISTILFSFLFCLFANKSYFAGLPLRVRHAVQPKRYSNRSLKLLRKKMNGLRAPEWKGERQTESVAHRILSTCPMDHLYIFCIHCFFGWCRKKNDKCVRYRFISFVLSIPEANIWILFIWRTMNDQIKCGKRRREKTISVLLKLTSDTWLAYTRANVNDFVKYSLHFSRCAALRQRKCESKSYSAMLLQLQDVSCMKPQNCRKRCHRPGMLFSTKQFLQLKFSSHAIDGDCFAK